MASRVQTPPSVLTLLFPLHTHAVPGKNPAPSADSEAAVRASEAQAYTGSSRCRQLKKRAEEDSRWVHEFAHPNAANEGARFQNFKEVLNDTKPCNSLKCVSTNPIWLINQIISLMMLALTVSPTDNGVGQKVWDTTSAIHVGLKNARTILYHKDSILFSEGVLN
eukprot:scaffold28685_cov14-Tisochrysis_lutea.AAC.1